MGVAHVSCLARQAKILYAEAEENNLGYEVLDERWLRWSDCSLCEQKYYGVVLPVARRVFGESGQITLTMRKIHAEAIYEKPGASLDDLREAVQTLEDVERISRRLLGAAHPRVLHRVEPERRASRAPRARDAVGEPLKEK